MLTFQRHMTKTIKNVRCFTSSKALLSQKDESNPSNEKQDNKNKGKTEGKIRNEEANTKLNNLLQMMVKKEEEPSRKLKVPQAVKREKVQTTKEKPLGVKLADVAKDVATSFGGDVQKTESELLNILLKRSEPDTQILKDVLSGMKVEKAPADSDSRAKQVRDTLSGQSVSSTMLGDRFKSRRRVVDGTKRTAAPVDILGAQPSSYFMGLEPAPSPCKLNTWDSCMHRDLRLSSTHPPANIYEQMVQWTNRGMLWHFPIDNEQGLEEEKQVSFEEHIFLETHLEGWCPEKGPVRHFMELVCVGLSKNHWLSAEEKKNHIYWFRDYFVDKQELLKELGAGTVTIEACEQKEISQ